MSTKHRPIGNHRHSIIIMKVVVADGVQSSAVVAVTIGMIKAAIGIVSLYLQCRVKTCTSVTSTQTDPLTGPVNHMTIIITIISHLTIMADITTISLIIIITMAAPIIGPINHAVVARHAVHHVVIITIVVVDNDVVRTEFTRKIQWQL